MIDKIKKYWKYIHSPWLIEKRLGDKIETVKSEIMMDYRMKLAIQEMRYKYHEGNVGTTGVMYDGCRIIVSLTSYSTRINTVYLAIESMLNQTVMPNKVVLWLSENEFNERTIPQTLREQKRRGLEIRYVRDIKSYKKLIFALKEFPEDIIITIDDDFIYSSDLIELLYKEYKVRNCICCTTAVDLSQCIGNKGEISYNICHGVLGGTDESVKYSPEGCGGILYPPHCFHRDVLMEEIFMSLAPTCDDIWFKIMSMLNNTPVYVTRCYVDDFYDYNIRMEFCQSAGLKHINRDNNHNDTQLNNLINYYGLQELIRNICGNAVEFNQKERHYKVAKRIFAKQ